MKAKKNQKKPRLSSHEKAKVISLIASNGKIPKAEEGIALVALLKECAKHKDLCQGRKIHNDIVNRGLLKRNVFLGSALVDMYAKCSALTQAREVFDNLHVRNVVTWTALIAGYTQQGHCKEALVCFEQMRRGGVCPNAITFACILKCCGTLGAAEKGSEIHDEIVERGLLGKCRLLGTALVDMYAKCGALARAKQVFDELLVRDVVAWTTLIGGYCHYKHNEEALNCFEQMQREGLFPDAVTFTYILQACGCAEAIDKGVEVHSEIERKGFLGKNGSLGNALVGMYAKCGAFGMAQEVLDRLHIRDVVSWTALIMGYAQHGHGEKAFICFERMKQEGHALDAVILACILQACGSIGAIEKGEVIHVEIARQGVLGEDSVLGGALVSMYAKCGALVRAHKVLDELPFREVASWTALIIGYAQHGQGELALACFDQMEGENIPPDRVTFICILQACSSIGATEKGREIHTYMIKNGLLGEDSVLGSSLLHMYVQCEALEEAQQVFDDLAVRNVGSWTMLIEGYCRNGQCEEVLRCFGQMQHEGLSFNASNFTCMLKACGSIGAIEKGTELHDEIVRKGLFGKDSVLGTALVGMYAKCGALMKAQHVFEELSVKDEVSWTALILGCVEHGYGERALRHFHQMQQEGLSPDAVTLLCVLGACASIGAVKKGIEIHSEIVRRGLLGIDGILESALVDMYAKCGTLVRAQEVFDTFPVRNVVSWTALIAGYAEYGHGSEALNCLEQMKHEDVSPNIATFGCILKACASIEATEKGKEVHDEIYQRELTSKSSVLGNSLVDMYAKCGAFEKAQEVLDALPVQDVISWTALISGHIRHCQAEQALNCFERMQCEGISPNPITSACLLRACGHLHALEKGKEVHNEIARTGWLGKSSALGNALVYMYASCGVLAKAQEVLNELPNQDEVSWTLLIEGYAQHGHNEEALACFSRMQCENLCPDGVTFTCIMQACGSIGAAERGKKIHAEVMKRGFLEGNCVLGNALMHMYAKCSSLREAQQVFNKLLIKDVVSWNVLITGYARAGRHTVVMESFNKMTGGIEPNLVTLSIVLNACSHFWVVGENPTYFETVCTSYGRLLGLEQETCIVNLLSRVGQFDEALALIQTRPSSDSCPAWSALLNACQTWGNTKAARFAFDHAIRVDKSFSVTHAHKSSIHVAVGTIENTRKVEGMLRKNEVREESEQVDLSECAQFLNCYWNKGHEEEKSVGANRIYEEKHCRGLHLLSDDVANRGEFFFLNHFLQTNDRTKSWPEMRAAYKTFVESRDAKFHSQ